MIVDTSALLAIVFSEPDAKRYADAILGASAPAISAPNWLEAVMVVRGRRVPGELELLGEVLVRLGVSIVPFATAQAEEAAKAAARFGKGSGNGAALNFGDCIAYGTARSAGQALLFKGADFARTDIASALAP